jgi:hypothetical protein
MNRIVKNQNYGIQPRMNISEEKINYFISEFYQIRVHPIRRMRLYTYHGLDNDIFICLSYHSLFYYKNTLVDRFSIKNNTFLINQ